eukprot:485655-Prymnesium_polylepis.2
MSRKFISLLVDEENGGTLDPNFIKHLVKKLQLSVFSPGGCVTEEGDTGEPLLSCEHPDVLICA